MTLEQLKNDTRLSFEKGKHFYKLDDKPITGVTSILGVINKPALLSWASGCASDYIRDEVAKIASKNDGFEYLKVLAAEWERILLEAKKAYAQKRDKAADIGSLAHAWCEKWIQDNAIPVEKELALITDNFVKWATDKKMKFLASELRVYDDDMFYCGTFDFLCEIDGKVYLGDLKTGSGIYPEMFLQTAAYQNALQKLCPEIKVEGNIIVNCRKDGKFAVETNNQFIDNFNGFKGALMIYRSLNPLKK